MGSGPAFLLGINCVYHESSACLLEGSRLIAFVEEERFTRRKRAKRPELDNADELPCAAIAYCMEVGRVSWDDLAAITISYDPSLRRFDVDDEVVAGGWGSDDGEDRFLDGVRRIPSALSRLAGQDVSDRVRWVPHHLAHAASAYLASPFDDAAVLTIDGIGERTTTLLAHGRATHIEVLREIDYPNSLGLLWEQVATFLGMDRYDGPAKVMGLAAFGKPERFLPQMRKLVGIEDGGFTIDNSHTCFRSATDQLHQLFGPGLAPGTGMDSRAADVAAALQAVTEDVISALVGWLRREMGSTNLCLAGGVALNCVANGHVGRTAGYDEIFVQPAASDAGTALGGALLVQHETLGSTDRFVMDHPYWGPGYRQEEIVSQLSSAGLPFSRPADICATVADLLDQGQIVGWFQGAAEIGPRALGNRSILADPRRTGVKDRINLHVKHREYWRPFSPSVLAEAASDWLDQGARSLSHGFMAFSYPVHPHKRAEIPAVIHVDGSARAQLVTRELNPRYHRLITEFHDRTGLPVVLNTSFNGPGEPIVCSPADAVARFLASGLDALVLDDFLVTERTPAGLDEGSA